MWAHLDLRHLDLLGILTCLGCASGGAGSDTGTEQEELAPFDDTLAEELQQVLEAGLEEVGGAGITLAVQLPDTELFVATAGIADRGDDRPLEPEDRFRIGSVSKTFIAASVLQLLDDGLLALDDPLAGHVDLLTHDPGITLRQLLDHTAGVPNYFEASELQSTIDQPWTDAQLAALIADEELLHEPGTAWSYSNSHYLLLGMVISEVTGAPWPEHVEARILNPLALGHTEIPMDDWGEVVPGYIGRGDASDFMHPAVAGAAGSLTASPADLVRWGQVFGSGALLSAESYAAQIEDPHIIVRRSDWYGLGTMLRGDSLEDRELELGHNGALNGAAAWMGYRPEREATMVVLGNAWPSSSGSYDLWYPMVISSALWDVIEAAD